MNFSEYEKEIERRKSVSVEALKEILKNLKNNGCIGTITIGYCGSGDSGEYDPIKSEGFDLDDASASEIESYIDSLLPPGWEINEGSYGKVTMDTYDQSIHVDHNDIVETAEHEEFDY